MTVGQVTTVNRSELFISLVLLLRSMRESGSPSAHMYLMTVLCCWRFGHAASPPISPRLEPQAFRKAPVPSEASRAGRFLYLVVCTLGSDAFLKAWKNSDSGGPIPLALAVSRVTVFPYPPTCAYPKSSRPSTRTDCQMYKQPNIGSKPAGSFPSASRRTDYPRLLTARQSAGKTATASVGIPLTRRSQLERRKLGLWSLRSLIRRNSSVSDL